MSKLAKRRQITLVGGRESRIQLDCPPPKGQRLVETASQIMRHHQRHVEEEGVRIMGREVLSPCNLFDRHFVTAKVAVRETREAPREGKVGVQRERPLMQRTCLLAA